MKKQLLYRAAATTVLGLSLTTGVAAAQTPYQHYNSNHNHSSNQVPTDNVLMASSVTNKNTVNAVNNTDQNTKSGDALVAGNRQGDTAKTGGATVKNKTDATVNVNQPSTTGGSTTGGSSTADDADVPTDPGTTPGNSNTAVLSKTSNTNTVNVVNNTDQNTKSGDATVVHNGKGGSATTGDVSATNTSMFNISVNS